MPRHLDAFAFDDLGDDDEDIEDAPTDSVLMARPYLPPDPGLVDYDRTIDELDELPVDAIDDMEPLDDEEDIESQEIEIEELDTEEAQPAQVTALSFSAAPPAPTAPEPAATVPTPAPATGPPTLPAQAPSAPAYPGAAYAGGPPLTASQLYRRMFGAFFGTMAVTFLLVILPWVVLVSPALETRRARAQQVVQVPQPVVVERVVPVPVPTFVAPEPVAPEADPEVPVEPGSTPEPEVVAAAPAPTPTPRAQPTPRPTPRVRPSPRVRPTPRAQPTPRPQPRARPAPAPSPKAAPAPRPAPAPAAKPTPEPAVAPVPVAPPTPPKTPPAALALNGRMRGKAGGDPLYMQVLLRSSGRATMHVKRGTAPWQTATGNYTLDGDRATLSVTEPGDAPARYVLTVDADGADGTITLPDGKEKPVKAKR